MRLKKAFAVILAIAMVFGAVSLAAAATPVAGGFADAAENKQADQVAYLRALGIAKGDENGNFNPDAALTRQEFVTFVARLAGQESAADFMGGIASRYLDDEDIADWARGPVNLADTSGWVQGYDDGKFHPQDTLTFAQAVTVLVRVLGHEPQVTGGYPNGYIIKGINLTLNNGVTLAANTPISRADMGRLLYNALFIPQAKKTADGWEDGNTLMHNRTHEGTVTAVSTSKITVEGLGERSFTDEVTVIGDVSGLLALQGLNVRVTSASDITKAAAKVNVVQVVDAAASGVLVVKEVKPVNDASTGFQSKNFIFFTDDSKVEYNGDTTYSLNGSAPVKNGGPYGQTNAAVYRIGDVLGKGDLVVVSESGGVAKHLQITVLDGEDDRLTENGVAQTKADNKDLIETENDGTVATGGASITLNGQGAAVTDLKKDDVVSYSVKRSWEVNKAAAGYDADDAATWTWRWVSVDDKGDGTGDPVAHSVLAIRNHVSGTVKSAKTTFKAGGIEEIDVTLTLADNSTKTVRLADAAAALGEPTEGDKVTYALNADGNAVYVVGVEALNNLVKVAYRVGSNLVVDRNGTEVTYPIDAGFTFNDNNLGLVGYLSVSNGKATGFAPVTVRGGGTPTEYEVIGVDTANGFVILKTGNETLKADGIYKAAFDGAARYAGDALGLSDIAKGNIVYVGEVDHDSNAATPDLVAIFKK